MSGADITRGERGPKGDHGQGGDLGLTGEQGEQGIQGKQGEHGESTVLSRNISVSFVALAVVFTLVVGFLAYNISYNRGLAKDGAAAKDALCALRQNIHERSVATAGFIANIQSGQRPPISGITIADLQRSLDGQRQTLQTLRSLNCP